MDVNNQSAIIFSFKTVQTNAIRVLFESLKNILSDVNFKADSSGIKLTAVDGTTTAIVNLFLHSEKFEEYTCENSINIGLNLASVFKILKGIKNTDTISFTILRTDMNNMILTSQNSDKKAIIRSKIKLLDMDEKIYNIPDIHFDSYITMPSTDFQTYISDLSNIASEIEIRSSSNNMTMTAKGDFAEQSITINETNDKIPDNVNEQSGIFNIKYIQLFTKSTNLCGTVEIYLKSLYPLTVLYNVANLGVLKYCLAPKL
jgi:proliferating cell nuclear antigen|tara:strand:- start:102 stop:878 length:777 start_codon:yes stop_codon:yes gene_type:complete